MAFPITVFNELAIDRSLVDRIRSRFRATGFCHAVIEDRIYPCRRGAWATWIPAIGAKFLNSIDGRLNCLHRNAPPRDEVLRPEATDRDFGRYSREEWRRAYTTSVSWRAAENAVAAQRLHAAGLGPRVLGLCVALRFRDGARTDSSFAAGFLCEDVLLLPPKPPASEDEFLAAGLRLDRLGSAIRQQVNGYVIDLNAAVGVNPVSADDDVASLEAQILSSVAKATGRH